MKEHNYALHGLQCRRFLRARKCFACESAMLKFEKRGENGLVKRSGVGGGECLAPTLRVTILPSLIFLRHNIKDRGRPPHRGLRPLLLTNSVWVL